MVVGGDKYYYLYFFGHKIVIFFLVMKKKILCKDYIGRQKSTIIHESKQEARLIFYLTYLYEQMILVPLHPIFSLYVALHYGSKALHTELGGKNGGFMCICIQYTSKQLNVQQPTRGWGVLSDKVLFTPSEKRSSPEVGFFLELCNLCVTYAQHDSLSLYSKDSSSFLYSPKFLEALLGIVLRNLLVMLFHTWFSQKTIRAD